MLSLHQLRCFLATYEHGSLTAAAEELGYAQPSVSEQIRALEKSLGAPAVPPGRPRRRADHGRRHRCGRTPSGRSPRPRRPGARSRA